MTEQKHGGSRVWPSFSRSKKCIHVSDVSRFNALTAVGTGTFWSHGSPEGPGFSDLTGQWTCGQHRVCFRRQALQKFINRAAQMAPSLRTYGAATRNVPNARG